MKKSRNGLEVWKLAQINHKAVKCAEILIPHRIPYGYIAGANVVSNMAKESILAAGFDKAVVVVPKAFYR